MDPNPLLLNENQPRRTLVCWKAFFFSILTLEGIHLLKNHVQYGPITALESPELQSGNNYTVLVIKDNYIRLRTIL